VEIIFDRGTLLLRDAATHVVANLPGVLWDGRVSSYRCAARHHQSLLAQLRSAGVRCTDGVPRPGRLDTLPSPELRPYQAASLTSWDLSGRRGVIVLPTGAGKTRIALAAIASSGVSALCLVPTRVLLEQWQNEVTTHLGIEAGTYGDGERTLRPVTIATFESAWRHMGSIGDRFGLLVVDEVHHFGAGLRDEAIEMCCTPLRLGLTATPPGGSPATRIADLVGPTCFELDLRSMSGPYLAPFDVITMHVDLDANERDEYERMLTLFRSTHAQFRRFQPNADWADFARAAMRTPDGRRALAAFQRTRIICSFPAAKRRALSLLLDRHERERTLLFTAENTTAYAIAREHLVMPFTCDIGRAERNTMLAHFRAGRLRCLVSSQVLNEGLDVPDADIAIIVGGRKGEREHVQRVGRVLRPAPGKRALVYELITRGTREERDAVRRSRALGR
jgi:superfamily II DNA or RNA helicase